MSRLALILFCFISWPSCSLAAISITEVAWMGDSSSANNEWIELYNSGSGAVDISDWTISDGMNFSVSLLGVVPSGQYVLLERNRSSEDYLIKPPFLVYTGALVNTGATLTLRRSDSAIEDQVAGGTDWESIGGDNTTKETAQYTNQGWVTAEPTPGKVTSAVVSDPDPEIENEEDDVEDEEDTEDATTLYRPNSSETVRLELSPVTLEVVVDVQSVAYVNQPVTMTATPQDISRSLIPSLQYEWNFGDLATGNGQVTTHTYRYPGTYVVTLYTSYKRQVSLTRHEITVLPVTMTMTRSVSGDIQLHNDSPYDIDVSGYKISGTKTTTFPPRSIMLPRSTITIPWGEVLTYQHQNPTVLDPRGAVVISPYAVAANFPLASADNTEVLPKAVAAETLVYEVSAPPIVVPSFDTSNPNFTFASGTNTSTSPRSPLFASSTTNLDTGSTGQEESEIVAPSTSGNNPAPIIAFFVILALAILALFLPRGATVTKSE